jgi:ABC-type transporter Mla MlaB component
MTDGQTQRTVATNVSKERTAFIFKLTMRDADISNLHRIRSGLAAATGSVVLLQFVVRKQGEGKAKLSELSFTELPASLTQVEGTSVQQ